MITMEEITEAREYLTEDNLQHLLKTPELGLPPQYLAAMAAEILELRARPKSIVDCVLEAQAVPDYSLQLDRIADALEQLAGCATETDNTFYMREVK